MLTQIILATILAQPCGAHVDYQYDDLIEYFHQCPSDWVLGLENTYHLDSGNGWNGLHGGPWPCDVTLPYHRALNGFYILDEAQGLGSDGWLAFGKQFVLNNLPDGWHSVCTDQWAAHTDCTCWPVFGCSCDISFSQGFAYHFSPPERAAIIVHEARHVNGAPHDAGSDCPAHASCDSSWDYEGANRFEVLWLAEFTRDNRGFFRQPDLRRRARDRANFVLQGSFRSPPINLRVDYDFGLVEACYPDCSPPPSCPDGTLDCCNGDPRYCLADCWGIICP